MNSTDKIKVIILTFISLFVISAQSKAASSDGLGPWADSVMSYRQGLTKNGLHIPLGQSNPQQILGVSEADIISTHSFSLGFGGNIVLWFNNWISSGSFLIDSDYPDFANEGAHIDVSENGTTWVDAGTIPISGIVNLPLGISCAKFVRITDTSDPSLFPDSAEGYDMNGIEAIGKSCNPATSAPGLPNTGTTGRIDAEGLSAITNPLVPALPNTGSGMDTQSFTWMIVAIILLGFIIIFMAWKTYKLLTHR